MFTPVHKGELEKMGIGKNGGRFFNIQVSRPRSGLRTLAPPGAAGFGGHVLARGRGPEVHVDEPLAKFQRC